MIPEIDAKLDGIFASITHKQAKTYKKYWKSITPRKRNDFAMRWVFAFLSIQTNWQNNVRAYEMLQADTSWRKSKQDLRSMLEISGVGLHNNRTNFIWDFWQTYKEDKDIIFRRKKESWTDFRARLVDQFNGIGTAKVSFALEMCFPMESPLICIDTHMARLYGYNPSRLKDSEYLEAEKDWSFRAEQNNLAPGIARHIYWDSIQKFSSPRYWSYILERKF